MTTKVIGWGATVIVIASLLAAACVVPTRGPEAVQEPASRPTNPFHARSDSEPGLKETLPSAHAGIITIESVQVVSGQQVTFEGKSTLPQDTCVQTQLLADGDPVAWWPADTWVTVQDGTWQFTVPLGEGETPEKLDPSVQYRLHAWQQDDPSVESVFWFDLAGPPAPESHFSIARVIA